MEKPEQDSYEMSRIVDSITRKNADGSDNDSREVIMADKIFKLSALEFNRKNEELLNVITLASNPRLYEDLIH